MSNKSNKSKRKNINKKLRKYWQLVEQTRKLWRERGENYVDKSVRMPDIITLESRDDYKDEYSNKIITYPTGEVGEWSYHNGRVWHDYYKRRNPKPPLIIYHYIIIPKDTREICIYIDDMLLDKYYVRDLYMRNKVCELLTPDISHVTIPTDHELYFINTYGFDSYEKIIAGSIEKNIRIKCLCDDVEIEIHFTRIL
jgi:hypothetical protein